MGNNTKKIKIGETDMGRKAGGKNLGNFSEEARQPIAIPEAEKSQLPDVFTNFKKDFISVNDLMEDSGLSYDTCAKIIREIKGVSDVFGISGCVHRTDYYMYLSFRFKVLKEASL